jgi:hypothetical protein
LLALAAARTDASFFPHSAFSSGATGTTAAAFLELPAGARAEAMGEAAAAGAEGAEAMFWNPAGLARLGPEAPMEASLSYNALLETTYAGAGAFALPTETGVWGGGLVYFSQSSLTAYDSVGNPGGSFTPNDLAVSASYARPLGPVLLGGSVKAIHSSISDAAGSSAALDLGVQAPRVAKLGDGYLDAGASVVNLGPPMKVGSVASPLPFNARAGVLWHASSYVNLALDGDLPVDAAPYVCVGGEAHLVYAGWKYSLRAGYDENHGRGIGGLSGLSAGGGLDAGRFRIDYAWVAFGDLGMTNRVSLITRF